MIHDDQFKIYVDQLRDGHVAQIDEKADCAFLAVDEERLSFKNPVCVRGECYLAGDELVFHLTIHVVSVLPCIICNDPVEVPVDIANGYEAIPLSSIPHGIFYMHEMVREAILLETKTFAECHEGHCPHRQDMGPYLKKT